MGLWGWPDPAALLTEMGLNSSASLCTVPISELGGMDEPVHFPTQRGELKPKAITGAFGFLHCKLPLFIRLEMVTEIY